MSLLNGRVGGGGGTGFVRYKADGFSDLVLQHVMVPQHPSGTSGILEGVWKSSLSSFLSNHLFFNLLLTFGDSTSDFS